MNVKRTAVLVACLATFSFPVFVSAHAMLPAGTQLAQSTADDETYKQFLHGVVSLSDLTELQKKQMMQIVATESQSQDATVKVEHDCEQQIWDILTSQQQDDLKSQNAKIFPPQ